MAGRHGNGARLPAGVARLTRLFAPLALVLGGCGPAAYPENDHLSTVDFWPEEELLFVASRYSGAVDVLRVPRGPRRGAPEFVERLSERARRDVVRIAVDRTVRRLWVADRRAVYVYPFAPRAPATRIAFGQADETPLSDLVLDGSGNGYVFLHGGTTIVRLPAATLAPEKWFEIMYPARGAGTLWASRAIVSRDGRYLLFQTPKDGGLLRLDLASREPMKIRRSQPIPLECSSVLWAADAGGASLAVFHCRGRWLGEIALDADLSRSAERYSSGKPE